MWRNAGSALVNAFYRVVFKNAATISSFRAIHRPLLESIFPYDLNFTFVDGLLAWNTQRIGQIEVEHHPRAAGRSGYDPRKLIVLALNLFTNFSLLPLQVVSWCGLALSGFGFLLVLFYLIQSLRSQIIVPGYASTMIAVLVVGGTQLLALGMIGEYLGRLHLNVNRKPQYTVRTMLSGRLRRCGGKPGLDSIRLTFREHFPAGIFASTLLNRKTTEIDRQLFTTESDQRKGNRMPILEVTHREHEYDSRLLPLLKTMQERHFWYQGRHRFLLDAVHRRLRLDADEWSAHHVVDLGGGCGGWLKYLLERKRFAVADVVLADSSAAALSMAAACLPALVERRQVDLMNLPWSGRWNWRFSSTFSSICPTKRAS